MLRMKGMVGISLSPGSALVEARVRLFGMLAQEFKQRELADDQKHLLKPRSHTTVATYRMYLQRFIRPRWDGQIAAKISHHAIQDWLQELKRHHNLANRTVNHLKGLMALVYKFGAWREQIGR